MKYLIYSVLTLLIAQTVMAQVPPPQRPGYCPFIENIQCEDTVIKNLSRWEYDEEYEYRQIRRACAGNYDVSCLNELIANVPRFDSDDLNEVTRLARSCQLATSSCVTFIKNKIPRFDFNSISDVTEVARACARADVNCMTRVCNTRGNNCRNKSNLMRIARSCYVQCD